MEHSNTRDLLVLAATAYKQKKFKEAGEFFALSMEVDGSDIFIEQSLADNYSLAAVASCLSDIPEDSDQVEELSSITQSISMAMGSTFQAKLRASMRSDEEIDLDDLDSESGCADKDEDDEDLDEALLDEQLESDSSTFQISSPITFK